MIQTQLKLKLTAKQETTLNTWLWNLTGVWNWSVRKIELDAQTKIYHSKFDFVNLLADHGKKLGIPSHTIQGVLATAWDGWSKCFKKIRKKPRLKGLRNKMCSIPFPDAIKSPKDGRISVPVIGRIRFHKMDIPEGKIKCGRIVKRTSGWYFCLFIDAEVKQITRKLSGEIGIDSGFKNLITTSDGEIIKHPRELEAGAKRLAQAQRGRKKKLVARLQERVANRKKDRNHKLSRRLVEDNILIAFTGDNIKGMARQFGKSVSSSAHAQLKSMLSYKSRASGTIYVEPNSANSTKTCSCCGSLSGPTGWDGLAVRQWQCSVCGAQHDRDINAATNTLFVGRTLAGVAVGMTVERVALH